MAIDKCFTKPYFEKDRVPYWKCQQCDAGMLLPKEKFYIGKSAETIAGSKSDEWEPEWTEGVFSALLICNNTNCGEHVSIAGKMEVLLDYPEDYDGYDGPVYMTVLRPKLFYPPLHAFPINKDVPELIRKAITDAFFIYWADISACCNKIRIVVELIMDDKKVVKAKTLHDRIEKFNSTNAKEAELLMAIKWLGNSGSHSNKLKQGDLIDAFEILEHVLNNLYETESERIAALAKSINSKKGPRGKK